jgi:hypothetical protein
MKNVYSKTCLGSYDFASYLTGAAYGNNKERIEQHLSDCDFCFETFIVAFNQFLDHPKPQGEGLKSFAYGARQVIN